MKAGNFRKILKLDGDRTLLAVSIPETKFWSQSFLLLSNFLFVFFTLSYYFFHDWSNKNDYKEANFKIEIFRTS